MFAFAMWSDDNHKVYIIFNYYILMFIILKVWKQILPTILEV